MKIVELFSSIDGEGIRTGKLVTFIRTYGCDLRCSYCDSIYALEGTDYTEMDIPTILDKCKELKNKCITLTGGEPLIHKDVDILIKELLKNGYEVNIETNGATDISKFMTPDIMTDPTKLFFTIDYKTPFSKMENKMYMDNFYKHIRPNDVVKFVCANEEDLDVMHKVVTNMKSILSKLPHIFISPVFGEIEPVELVKYITKYDLQDVRVQLQIHKLIWEPTMKGV